MDRRAFLSTAIAACVSATAGCSGGPDAGETPTTSAGGSPTDAATASETPSGGGGASTPEGTTTPDSATSAPTGDREPAAQVTYEFYAAFLRGDYDAANALAHPDHPEDQDLPVTEENVGDTDGVEILDARVDETEGEYAYVEVGIDDNGSTFETMITLRTHEGEWMIWAYQDCRNTPAC